ncbi:hypothetical protein UC8_08960 [Roseimaritima ulvae]|uniref:Uncharacterized protein n=1 Tax=Roseimaritima ulvae TaxID=980254 RepID=A0A5B9QPI6_9BACT|nr:hypothetical protein UC8_08960 [Roseimaritima ulvae]
MLRTRAGDPCYAGHGPGTHATGETGYVSGFMLPDRRLGFH